MTYTSKLIPAFVLIWGLTTGNVQSQEKTQSLIYDAATLMNAKHGLNALLIPQAVGWDIENPLTKQKEGISVTVTDDRYFDPAASEDVMVEILRRNAGLSAGATREQVIDAYKANPFLKDLLSAARFRPAVLSDSDKQKFGAVGNFTANPGSGGLGHDLLGNLVNGTADFLIKRAQEEISISVFEKLKQFITRYPELDTLFPQTCALIKPVEAYDYNKALDAFKAAINADLQNFVAKVPALYSIPRYAQLNKRAPALTLVFTACSVFTDLHGEQGLATTMYDLRQQTYLGEDNNYSNFIKVLVEISNSLLDKTLSDPEDKKRNYIQIEFISRVTHGDAILQGELGKFYLGLLWQHIQSYTVNVKGARRSFASLLEADSTKLQWAIGFADATLRTVHHLDSALGELKKEEADDAQISGRLEIKAKRFIIYSDIVSSLLEFSTLFTDPANSDYAMRVHEIAQYLPEFTTGVTNVIKDFYSKEYSLGISDFAKMLQTVSDYLEKAEADKNQRDPLVSDLTTALTGQKTALDSQLTVLDTRIQTLKNTTASGQAQIDIQAEIQELTVSRDKLQASADAVNYQLKNKETVLFKLSKIIEYMQLFAAITKAGNSQAVEDLLETYALPAGSSRIKKVSAFNIAVNAYVGGFGGRKKDMGEGFTNTYGLTAPIGFSFSNGWGKAGSASIFLGVFDIGGIIRYKLNNEGQYEQNVTLAGIVSPGVHVVYGFPFYLPVSIGAGCQWISPGTSDTDRIDLKPTFNAFLSIDIPIFNLLVVRKK
ncbi:MAG TPA: hypothetical protein VHC96_08120 [Puia sp.]|nr:hypothetical protein [Puia sp.]